jgi:hypothetical protein
MHLSLRQAPTYFRTDFQIAFKNNAANDVFISCLHVCQPVRSITLLTQIIRNKMEISGLCNVYYIEFSRYSGSFAWINKILQVGVAQSSVVRQEYESVSKSVRTGRLERELQMVQHSAARCSCIAILWVSLVSFAVITLCIASQRLFVAVSIHFVINSVRKLLDTPFYTLQNPEISVSILDHLQE